MKRQIKTTVILLTSVLLLNACGSVKTEDNYQRPVKKEAKAYWYDGKAEISSYRLSQARYGEIHEGTAVLVYVTEPFSRVSNTKADQYSEDNVSVLKLNTTKKFLTGIYPYSMMSSTFFPFENAKSSIKMSASIQEWCGMTYMEMANRQDFVFSLNSYFEGASFKDQKVSKEVILEDDLWSLIRLNPEKLPVGELEIVPSMFFLRLRHKDLKAYNAKVKLYDGVEGIKRYELNYPDLERQITIEFEAEFPHAIVGWEESHYSGFGPSKAILTTKGELIKTVKTDYWRQNSNEHLHWRDKLGL